MGKISKILVAILIFVAAFNRGGLLSYAKISEDET